MKPTVVSLFAGVGGFDLGFERAGFTTVGQCEIDPHAVSVLKRHWPDTPKHDDVTTLKADTFGPADVITFGSPCQDLSVAGKRAGLDGERSGLFLEAVRYIREMLEETNGRYPRVAVWENVPGAYSSNGGADFAAVLESLVGGEVRRPTSGWANAGVAFGPLGSAEWRTLDSQYFGVPQRRRRIFLVYHPGGERAGQVLLEPDGVPGHPPSRRSPGEGITGALTGGAGSSSAGNVDDNRAQAGFVVPVVADTLTVGANQTYGFPGEAVPVETSPTVLASWGHHGYSSPRGDGTDPIVPVAFKVRGGKEGGGKGYLGSEDQALTLDTTQSQYLAEPVAFVASDYSTGAYEPADKAEALTTSADRTRAAPITFAIGSHAGAADGDASNASHASGGPVGLGVSEELAYALRGGRTQSVASPYAVRRLTPKECERLQGFPDNWTALDHEGREIADTHRYRMMGNAVTVTVAEWIARRLKEALS